MSSLVDELVRDELKNAGIFYYSEMTIRDGRAISGWSYNIGYDEYATYSKFKLFHEPVSDIRHIPFYTVNKIRNMGCDNLLLFRDSPIIINADEEANDGILYCLSYNTISFGAFNVPRTDFVRPGMDTKYDQQQEPYPDAVAMFDIFDRVTRILQEGGIYLNHQRIGYRILGENEEMGLNDLAYTFDLPFKFSHRGIHFDAYTNSKNEAPVFCECCRKPMQNVLKLCEDFLDYESSAMSSKEVALKHIGVPEYYRNRIDEMGDVKPIEWMSVFEYGEKLCPFCNEAIVPEPRLYLQSPSKFEQRYEHELDRRFLEMGVFRDLVDFYGLFFIKDELPDAVYELLVPSDYILTKEICEASELAESFVKSQFDRLNELSEEEIDAIKYWRSFSKCGRRSYELVQDYNLDESFTDCLQKCIWKRFLQFSKQIHEEVKQDAKLADKSKKTGGSSITITEYNHEKEIKIQIEKEKGLVLGFYGKEQVFELEINYNILDAILKHLDYKTLANLLDFHIVGKEKKVWEIKGAGGDKYSGYMSLDRIIAIRLFIVDLIKASSKK